MWNPFVKKTKACSYCGGKAPKAGSIWEQEGRIFCSLSCVILHNTLTELEQEGL